MPQCPAGGDPGLTGSGGVDEADELDREPAGTAAQPETGEEVRGRARELFGAGHGHLRGEGPRAAPEGVRELTLVAHGELDPVGTHVDLGVGGHAEGPRGRVGGALSGLEPSQCPRSGRTST